MSFQVRDVLEAMTRDSGSREAGKQLEVLRVDGGASVMNLLLQMLADQIQAPVARPVSTETTAFGAAALAGLAEGVWGSVEELEALWKLDEEFAPKASRSAADGRHALWLRAVDTARSWA
jgi:glycerol kinase